MKKIILFALLIPTIAYGAFDVSSFQTVRTIEEKSVKQPTVVEIKGIPSSSGYVVTDREGNAVPLTQQVYKTFIAPMEVIACAMQCASALELVDNDMATTFDFPLWTKGKHTGKISITYAKPIVTNSIIFNTTNDSYTPSSFSLVIDGKRILNSILGNRAMFPQMMAEKIEVEFEYEQSMRFTEVDAGSNFEENNIIRFVYEPNKTYKLYTNAARSFQSGGSPQTDLFSKTNVSLLSLGEAMSNSLYEEPDFDADGIIDKKDNCPLTANTDQSDTNGNQIGDVCDDYDFDGVATNRDNCPQVLNRDQLDTDKDGVGDACDPAESRFTEKYPWLPWTLFTLVFLTIIYMAYDVFKGRKKLD